jgi:transposase
MEGPENLELVTIGMWRPYRDAVRAVFGDVPVVVDRFHVIKNLMRALDSVRSLICKQVKVADRRALKRNRYLLLCSNENLTMRQGADLAALLERFPEFKTVYVLKESFRDIYATASSSDEAKAMFEDWCRTCEEAGCDAYDGFIKTVRAWEGEVFAYFDFPGMARTNAQTESLNRSIRTIARAGRGYTFDVLRKKVLLARYAYEPEERFSFSDLDD